MFIVYPKPNNRHFLGLPWRIYIYIALGESPNQVFPARKQSRNVFIDMNVKFPSSIINKFTSVIIPCCDLSVKARWRYVRQMENSVRTVIEVSVSTLVHHSLIQASPRVWGSEGIFHRSLEITVIIKYTWCHWQAFKEIHSLFGFAKTLNKPRVLTVLRRVRASGDCCYWQA